MANDISPLQKLRAELLRGAKSLRDLAGQALENANQNASHNVYISLNENWTLREADRVQEEFSGKLKPPLFGLPVSLKDCFDLEGFCTTAGTRYYAEKKEIAREDSAVAKRLRAQGAIITGKTNLHPLAYGITGENPDFGDCLQPADATLLTGGSSSGGAASVQEGSAVAAIGTDTGGSIRVPAALCGLAGYRASINLAWERGLWRGGVHLAESFDTLGWIFRDLRDAPLLAEGLFGLQVPHENILGGQKFQVPPDPQFKIGAISRDFLHDCDGNVLAAFASCQELLRSSGADVKSLDAAYWDEALSIYAPIQASEAAAIHADSIRTGATRENYSSFPAPSGSENFSHFPKAISERLAWGASLSTEEVQRQRQRHAEFRARLDTLFQSFDFLIMPCSPISKLEANQDHTPTRPKILRYTAPLSLAGTPVVTLPFPNGTGIQLAAPRGQDSRLLVYAATLANRHPFS